MAKKFIYALSNGKTLELEGDDQPSDEEVESIASEQGVKLQVNEESTPVAIPTPIADFSDVKSDSSVSIPEEGLLKRGWDLANKPLTEYLPDELNPSLRVKARHTAENLQHDTTKDWTIPFSGGATWRGLREGLEEGAVDTAAGLTSPLNLATTAAFGGSNILAKQGLKGGAAGLHMLGQGLSIPVAGHGGMQIVDPNTSWGEKAFGVAELAGGLAGIRSRVPTIGKRIVDKVPDTGNSGGSTGAKLKLRFNNETGKLEPIPPPPPDNGGGTGTKYNSSFINEAGWEEFGPKPDLPPDLIPVGEEGGFNQRFDDAVKKPTEDILFENASKRFNMGRPKETAEFLGLQENGEPLFNIIGGERDKSTVSGIKLKELGIDIPEVPSDARPMRGSEIREMMLAKRDQALNEPLNEMVTSTEEVIPNEIVNDENGIRSTHTEGTDPYIERDLGLRGIDAQLMRLKESRRANLANEATLNESIPNQVIDVGKQLPPEIDPFQQRIENMRADTERMRIENAKPLPIEKQNEIADWDKNQRNTARYEGRNINDIHTPPTPTQQRIRDSFSKIKEHSDKYSEWFAEQENVLPEGEVFKPPFEIEAKYKAEQAELYNAHQKLVDKLDPLEKPRLATIDIEPVSKLRSANEIISEARKEHATMLSRSDINNLKRQGYSDADIDQILQRIGEPEPVGPLDTTGIKQTESSRTFEPNQKQLNEEALAARRLKPKDTIANEMAPKLPRNLQGGKPRFNIGNKSYEPIFESDLDKALFIIAQKDPSKHNASYLKFVTETLNIDEKTAVIVGRKVRATIKGHLAGQEPGQITIPDSGIYAGHVKRSNEGPRELSTQSGSNIPPNKPPTVPPASSVPPSIPPSIPPRKLDPRTQALLDARKKVPSNPEDIPAAMQKVNNRAEALKMAPPAKKASLYQEIKDTHRALLTGFDISYVLRQGKGLITHPVIFKRALVDMYHALGSKEANALVEQAIIDHPSGYFKPGMDAEGNATPSFAERAGVAYKNVEENLSSNWAETGGTIPYLSKGYKQTVGRLYGATKRGNEAFIHKGRADLFASLMDEVKRRGVDPTADLVLAEKIAKSINTSTGRGSFGSLEHPSVNPKTGEMGQSTAMKVLNEAFFAPKFMASRVQMYTRVLTEGLNPFQKIDPILRKEALRSLFGIVGTGLLIQKMAQLAGAKVNNDPTNPDFRKIKIGDTRIDNFSGLGQYGVGAAQFLTGQKTSSLSNKSKRLSGGFNTAKPKYGAEDTFDLVTNFAVNRAAPIPSLIISWMHGRDFDGKTWEWKKALAKRMAPLITQDLYDLQKEDPKLIPVGILPVLGESIQTYGR